MSSLRLFGIPFDKAIGVIGNAHILLIVSLVFSVAYDFQRLDPSRKVELDGIATVTSTHFVGFVLWQIIHLFLGRILLSCVNPCNYGLLSLCEMVQGYFTIVYFWNPFITMYWNASRSFLMIFKYTALAEYYVVYITLGLSAATSILLMFSHDNTKTKANAGARGEVLGISYKTCESIIYWTSFFTFIPTVIAFLCDCLHIINFSYISGPSQSQMVVTFYYAFMVVYQYSRYLSLLFPYMEWISFSFFLAEICQLVAFLLFYFNPWRPTDKKIFEHFQYTTLAQKVAIPILVASLVFNSFVYYLISRKSQGNATKNHNEKENSTKIENKIWPKRRGAIRRRKRT